MNKFFEGKEGLLYAALLGAAIGNAIPNAADALYLQQHKKLRDKWSKGEMTAKQYWTRNLLQYYGYNTAWFLLIFGTVYFVPKFENKLRVAVLMMGVGVGAAMIYKTVKKDELQNLCAVNKEKEQIYQDNK